MALTLDQARQAGELAAEITALQAAVDDVNASIAAGAAATDVSANVMINGEGRTMRAVLPLDAATTASLFKQVIAVYQAKLDALNSALAALV